jgi:penicillin G amidase
MLRVLLLAVIFIQLLFPTGMASVKNYKQQAVYSGYTELQPQTIPGLKAKVELFEDELGVPHIFAKKSSDVFFMQGFLHARDRFFQMDVQRRTAEGTLAELLGNRSLQGDVQLRAFGLARAAAAALPMLRPETRRILKDYTRGVNAYLKDNPLPAEYQQLKITQKRMWTEVDSLTVGKLIALGLSFSTNDITATTALQTYEAAGKAQGFNGTALFFEDLFRSAPFDPTFAIPDATGNPPTLDLKADESEEVRLRLAEQKRWSRNLNKTIKPETLEMARKFAETIASIPYLGEIGRLGEETIGSNWFIIGGKNTTSGAPLLNNDPHLGLSSPPVWYQIQLNVNAKGDKALNVIGVSFPGIPGVVLGHNDNIAWSATVTGFDVTDVFQEEVVLTGLTTFSIVHDGKQEPVTFREETFRQNLIAADKSDNVVVVPPSGSVFGSFPPPRIPIVPRRNNGPIVSFNGAAGTALSIQYTGFGPTFEVEAFLDFNKAKTIEEFRQGLQFFDFGSQNFGVVSTSGDIAYFTSGEVPLREDLETGKVSGAPPFFIRDGRKGNEWKPLGTKQPQQALSTEILPFSELPQVVNPAKGFVVTANADMVGTTASNNPLGRKRANGGIYYLSAFYANGSRAARITRDITALLNSGKKIGIEEARRIQSSVQMRDAEIFTPFILQAFDNAMKTDAPAELAALAANAGVKEAVGRLSRWDFTTPTGLSQGFDASVPAGSEPTQTQINNSVSTTIYSLWRSQVIRNVFDNLLAARQLPTVDGQLALAALRNLLDNFSTRKGVGLSGIDFFAVQGMSGASAETRRDLILLQSLRQALDLLAGPDFQLAFNNSTNQNDYRWGMLHRIIFVHPLGTTSEFSIPSGSGIFRSPFPGLPGIPRDGGVEVPNASGHNVRARTVNGFMFGSGPSQRLTVVMKPGAIEAVNAIPGGQSGALNNKFRENLLNFWLVGNQYPFVDDRKALEQKGQPIVFMPKK